MPSLPQGEFSRAVLIGTSDFELSERLPSLPAVQQNLVGLSEALRDSRSGILARDQCVIIDTPDSPASFLHRLRKVANQAEDLLLVYYAGHGIRHGTRDELYLTVRETNPDLLNGTAVPFSWLRETIENSPARTKLVILDCCYSGMALEMMSGDEIDSREIDIFGTSVIASAPKNQISHSPPGERYTAFTAELLDLLTNGPRITDQPLTVQNLYRGLLGAMSRRELPTPKMQTGDLSGDLLLRRSSPHQKQSSTASSPSSEFPPRKLPQSEPPQSEKFTPAQQSELNPTEKAGPRESPHKPVDAYWNESSQILFQLVLPTVRRISTANGWLFLWLLFGMLTAMVFGSLAGYFVGKPPPGATRVDDLYTAIGAAVFAAFCLAIFWGRAVYRRKHGDQVTIFGELRNILAATVLKWPTILLAVLTISIVSLAIVGLFMEDDPTLDSTSTSSNTATTIGVELWLAQLVGTFCYGIFQRRRQSKIAGNPKRSAG